jgi:bifunctional enzyme CysN/CysC
MAKELIGEDRFVEVYVSTTLEVCEERDVKGLYKKARSGQLPNLSGVGSPYEAPDHTALNIDAANTDLKCAVDKLMTHIK